MKSRLITLRRRSLIGRRHPAAEKQTELQVVQPVPPETSPVEQRAETPVEAPLSDNVVSLSGMTLIPDVGAAPLSIGAPAEEQAETSQAMENAVAEPVAKKARRGAELAESSADQSEAAQISRKFVAFAGSGANARALVTGLHTGGVIALNGDTAGAEAVSFVAAIGELRYGHIFIALAMAEQILAKAGFAKPAPEQIKAVLTGGAIDYEENGQMYASYLPGVLQLRSRGLAWRAIAQAHGLSADMGTSRDRPASGGKLMMKIAGGMGGTGATMLAVAGMVGALALPGAFNPITQASASTAQPQMETAASKLFVRLDSDHDGYVSRAEAARQKDFIKAFDAADINHRGKLAADDFVVAESIYQREIAANTIDDSVITATVKARLARDPAVAPLELSVETYQGKVLLSGFVDRPAQVREAQRVASSVRGVQSVHNNLFVK
jgi:hyperosmotically inducible protein